MEGKELEHVVHGLLHLVHEYGFLGSIEIILGFTVAAVILGAWISLAEWLLRGGRSLGLAYLGGIVAALAASVSTLLCIQLFDIEGARYVLLVVAFGLYGFGIGSVRD